MHQERALPSFWYLDWDVGQPRLITCLSGDLTRARALLNRLTLAQARAATTIWIKRDMIDSPAASRKSEPSRLQSQLIL